MPHNANETETGRTYALLVAAIYLAAVLLRVWRVYCGVYLEENAQVGLMAMDFLRGHVYVFHIGRDYHGPLDVLLQAPFYALFGPTHLVQNIWNVTLNLLAMALLHPVLKRVLSPAGVLVGLALMAAPPSPAMLWGGYGQLHIIGMIPLLAWHLLQTARLWENPEWKAGTLLWWGVSAGVAFYVNFQAALVIAPTTAFLLAACWRRLRPKHFAWAMLGGALGASPFIYFNLAHNFPHFRRAGQFTTQWFWDFLSALFHNGLPIALGFTTPMCGGPVAAGSGWFLLYLACVAGLGLGLGRLAWQGLFKGRTLALLPVLLTGANLAVLLVTPFGKGLSSCSVYHMLCFYYLALPFLWGALADAAAGAGKRPALAAAVGASMLGIHAWGYATWTHMWNIPLFCTHGQVWQQERAHKDTIARLRAAGVGQIYKRDPFLLAFYGAGRPEVANPWEDWVPWRSVAVDSAPDPYWWMKIKPSLDFLGLPYSRIRVAGATLFHGVRAPGAAGRLLPGEGWRARALSGRDLGGWLNDGDWSTGYITRHPPKQGDGFVLDLGREREVGGVSMIAGSFREVPAGLRLETAGNDGAFSLAREVGNYWGPFYLSGPHPFLKLRYPRVESYFPARRVRYLRVSHLGQGPRTWSVRELMLFGPDGQGKPADWAASRNQLLQLVERLKPKTVYADAWPSALVRGRFGQRVKTVIANQIQTVWGSREPDILTPLPLDSLDQALLVVRRRAQAPAARALKSLGVAFAEHLAGEYAVLQLQGRKTGPRLALASISSNQDQANAAALAKGAPPAGRWASGGSQAPGMGLTLDLGQPARAAWLRLDNPGHPLDYPRSLKAEVSDDGRQWREISIALAGPLTFSGRALMKNPGPVSWWRLEMPRTARFIRFSIASAHPVFWWSVRELSLYGP